MGRCLCSLRAQVREKIKALRKRRAELESSIAILSRAESTICARRDDGMLTSAGDSTARAAIDDATLVSVKRSLAQARRLHEQFDRRWGFARDNTLGVVFEVRACVGVCVFRVYVRACVCVYVSA